MTKIWKVTFGKDDNARTYDAIPKTIKGNFCVTYDHDNNKKLELCLEFPDIVLHKKIYARVDPKDIDINVVTIPQNKDMYQLDVSRWKKIISDNLMSLKKQERREILLKTIIFIKLFHNINITLNGTIIENITHIEKCNPLDVIDKITTCITEHLYTNSSVNEVAQEQIKIFGSIFYYTVEQINEHQ